MTFPSAETLPGGQQWITYPDGGESRGQFARFPAATPKYAQHAGHRDAEYKETMARMFIQMPKKERARFVRSVSKETQPLAKALAGGVEGFGFMDFLLTDVTEPFQEKYQVVETLSDNFIVYLFGQRAPVFQYSGVLLNTYQDDQRVWMTRLYQDVLRGTQLARRHKLVRIRYDSVIVSGVLVSMQQSLEGDAADWLQFSFSLIPTQYTIFTPNLGKPTQLKQPSIPSKGYGLTNVAVPKDNKLRTVHVSNKKSLARQVTEKKPKKTAKTKHVEKVKPEPGTVKVEKVKELTKNLYRPVKLPVISAFESGQAAAKRAAAKRTTNPLKINIFGVPIN